MTNYPNKLKYYSTEKLYDILDEIENGDGGRGMKDLMLAEYIKDLIEIRENKPWLFIRIMDFLLLLPELLTSSAKGNSYIGSSLKQFSHAC